MTDNQVLICHNHILSNHDTFRKGLKKANRNQISRTLKARFPLSFPSHNIKEIAKIINRCITRFDVLFAYMSSIYFKIVDFRLVLDFKRKETGMGGSGQTGPANTPDENLVR